MEQPLVPPGSSGAVTGDSGRKAGRRFRVPRRLILLVASLVVLLVVYAATGRARAQVWDRMWLDRLAVNWARQEQDSILTQRKLRGNLREQLRALVQNPEDAATLLKTASAYAQLRQYDDALFLLGEADRVKPKDAEVYRARSQVYFSTGKYDRCIDTLTRGLEQYPDDLELNLLRLDVDAVLGWTRQAEPRLRRMLARYGAREARVHLMAALLARQLADERQATDELHAAMRLNPGNDRVYGILSGLEWELGHREAALEYINQAIKLNPTEPNYYLHLAEIQRQGAGRTPAAVKQAERSYQRALDLAPSNAQARYGIAVCRLDQGDRIGLTMLEELLRVNPHLPLAQLELGNRYMQIGRREEGAALLARYQDSIRENDELKGISLRMVMRPNDAATYRDMGDVHLRTGSPEKAIVMLRRALRLNPKDQASRRKLQEAALEADRGPELEEMLRSP